MQTPAVQQAELPGRHAKRGAFLVVIGHGLTADTRRALLDGTMDAVFDQNPDTLIDRAIAHLSDPSSPPKSLKFDIHFRENLP
jgi:LacI family transcriptional regulator